MAWVCLKGWISESLISLPFSNGPFCLRNLWVKPPLTQTWFWCVLSVQQNGWSHGVNWTEMAGNDTTENGLGISPSHSGYDGSGWLLSLKWRNAGWHTQTKSKCGGQNFGLLLVWHDPLLFLVGNSDCKKKMQSWFNSKNRSIQQKIIEETKIQQKEGKHLKFHLLLRSSLFVESTTGSSQLFRVRRRVTFETYLGDGHSMQNWRNFFWSTCHLGSKA